MGAGKPFAELIGFAVLAVAGLYVGSEWVIRRSHVVPDDHVAVPADSAAIAEGGRLATLAGCRGCHGPDGAGMVWSRDLPGGTIAPPAIARKIASYSDGELVRLIRYGVKKDGSTLFIMPTTALRNWSDDDLGKIVAWLRTLKPGRKDSRAETSFGPMTRLAILTGGMAERFENSRLAPTHRPPEVGRYYYDAICSDCHALGQPRPSEGGQVAPALAPMAASYAPAGFRALLRTGAGRGGADLGLMSRIAKEATHALADAEIVALQAYLKGEAAKLPGK